MTKKLKKYSKISLKYAKTKHFYTKIQKKCKNPLIMMIVVFMFIFTSIMPLQTFCSNSFFELSEDLNSSVVQELNEIDFSQLNDIVDEFNKNNSNIFSIDNIKAKIYSIISGENAISYSNFFASLFSNLIEKIIKYLPILSLIISIGILSNLLDGIKSKFDEKSTGNLIKLGCLLTIIILIVGVVTSIAKNAGNSISLMVKQMNILFPILLTLMVGMGAHATSSAFQPIVAILSTYIADFFNFFIVPLFMLSFVFGIISNLSDNVKLDKFNSLFSSIFKWGVGLVFTIFFAVFSLQGLSAGSFDSLSIRTTKFTIKSYVPIMGGYLSDGMDLILSSTVLIKNAVGFVGILLIASTIISPIIEIAIFSLMLKLISAVIQPMGNNKISSFLSSTSKSITMFSTAIIAIGFMYLLSVGLIMTTSNMVVL